jgi:hypothetical protein
MTKQEYINFISRTKEDAEKSDIKEVEYSIDRVTGEMEYKPIYK